jgi:hypothetical protein
MTCMIRTRLGAARNHLFSTETRDLFVAIVSTRAMRPAEN